MSFAFLLIIGSQAQAGPPISGCPLHAQRSLDTLHNDLTRQLQELNHPDRGVPRFTYQRVRDSVISPEKRVPSARYTNHASLYQSFHAKTLSVLKRMEQKVASGYSYSCVSSRDGGCRAGAYAYVKFIFNSPVNKITFCSSFWELDHKEQLRTLFHELSHLAALTTDDLGNIFTDEGIVSQANEAYFYEALLDDDLEQALKIRSWGLLWLKPKPKPEKQRR